MNELFLKNTLLDKISGHLKVRKISSFFFNRGELNLQKNNINKIFMLYKYDQLSISIIFLCKLIES